MRGLRNFIVGILSAIIIVVLAIFAVQNLHGVTAHFLGWTFTANLWWVSIGSAVLGFILALLLLAPGRIASGWRARGLERNRLRVEQDMSALRQEHESLRAQHAHYQAELEGLQTERDQLRARLATVNEAANVPESQLATGETAGAQAVRENASTTHPVPVGTDDTSYGAGGTGYSNSNAGLVGSTTSASDSTRYGADTTAGTMGDANDRINTAQPTSNQTVMEPGGRSETSTPETQSAAEPAAEPPVTGEHQQQNQLGVGERLREMFGRPRGETAPEDQHWDNNQPPVPNA